MKNILVTGSRGQLGNELRELAGNYPDLNIFFTDLPELDITNHQALNDFLKNHPVDFLINCAAYTAVDKAESEPQLAGLVNAKAVEMMAEAAVRKRFALIHISTDYIFSGQHYKPYLETDLPDPVSVYAKSKYKGEQAILDSGADALIIRTSWLYSPFGHNFVKTILRLSQEKEELRVVFDQIGTPTYAADLAKSILDIISGHIIKGVSVYNFTNEGVCSWYDFAETIVQESGLKCRIVPIRTSEYPTPAFRPPYSVLDKSKIKNDFQLQIPWWKDSLVKCLRRIEQGVATKG
jgi:dTDP-4-dehydrorhamnose reductase